METVNTIYFYSVYDPECKLESVALTLDWMKGNRGTMRFFVIESQHNNRTDLLVPAVMLEEISPARRDEFLDFLATLNSQHQGNGNGNGLPGSRFILRNINPEDVGKLAKMILDKLISFTAEPGKREY
jgi:hypothetical protein